MNWLIEPEVFKGEADSLIETLDNLKVKYTLCKFGTPYEDYTKIKVPTIFYGSLQFAKIIKESHNPHFVIYGNFPKYDCSYYYPRLNHQLLNRDYIILPIGDVLVKLDWLQKIFESSDLYIRPNSCFKLFGGKVLENKDQLKTLKVVCDADVLVLIAKPKKILKEWRLVVIDGRIVAGSQYKEENEIVRNSQVPDRVMKYSQLVVDYANLKPQTTSLENLRYNPDPVWVIDVCELENKDLKIVEVGTFSCSGLYACNWESIVKTLDPERLLGPIPMPY